MGFCVGLASLGKDFRGALRKRCSSDFCNHPLEGIVKTVIDIPIDAQLEGYAWQRSPYQKPSV